MNTPTPAQALGEVLELSAKATRQPWSVEFGEAVKVRAPGGTAICTINWLRGPHGQHGRIDADEGEANARLIAAAVNLASQQGQHFAALEREVDRLHAELDFLTAQHEQCLAYMVNHRGRLVYANSGMRDAYSDEHVRAETAEARCAELERLSDAISRDCNDCANQRNAAEARVREAEGLLRETVGEIRDAATDARVADYPNRANHLDSMAARIAAFLAASCYKS